MKLWDVRQRRETAAFAAHTDFVSDFALHEPRQTLLAVSGDGTLTATDLRTNKVRWHPGLGLWGCRGLRYLSGL